MNQNYITKARRSIKPGQLKNPKPLLFVLMGLPGTGKSYLAHHLNEKYSFVTLSGENTAQAIFGTEKLSRTQHKEVYEILRFLAAELLSQHYSVVIDGTNLKYEFRKEINEALGELSKPILIYLFTDDKTALKQANSRKKSYDDPTMILSGCSPETFAAFKAQLESPRENEKFYEVVSDEKLFEKVDAIVTKLLKERL